MKVFCDLQGERQAKITAWIKRAQAIVSLLLGLTWATACGTIEISLDTATAPGETPAALPSSTPEPTVTAAESPTVEYETTLPEEAVAWYGTFHSIAGGEPSVSYFKPWHLDIWPKHGPALGFSGVDAVIDAEIDRLLDTDTKATVWGTVTCGSSTYGPCQLAVTQISASDGGPAYEPERAEGWLGTVGALPVEPGSQEVRLYLALHSEIPVLYGIGSADQVILEALSQLVDSRELVQVWGEVRSRAQPVTGTLIEVSRLERLGSESQ